jgi:hypothetical protein
VFWLHLFFWHFALGLIFSFGGLSMAFALILDALSQKHLQGLTEWIQLS